nr:hypothetical protein [Tanacetum cinerariifolium]
MANDEEDHALVADEVAPTEFALMANTSAESKQEKGGVDGKLAGLLTASKDLYNLIESQRSEKNKEGLGYNVVPPPTAQLFLSPKKDLSWIGLPECADDTVTDYSRPSPTVESISEDDQKKFPTASRKFLTSSTKGITADMGLKGKAVKPSACWFWRPSHHLSNKGQFLEKINDKGYWDSGCSRHMTCNISYLSDYEPYDGGYVSFGQGGCKIKGKGKIKTGKLEFENVYFVKDLKYNLFSMSQTCDTKNSVLFTDLECIVLGRDFKLLDDANILLRTPRQHNMYSIDLNNIVPHRDLTCLVAKASVDGCMLWHGRLDEEVYVMQPPGFHDPEYPAKVYKVEKAMGTIDQTLFIRRQREDFILVQVYVDDIIFGSSNPQLCREFEALMHDKFQMSAMGDILKKFGFSDVRSSNTPMDKENPWGKDGPGKDVELHLYRSMIGSLMYLTASRPDIMFDVCACARHQVIPKECHLHAVKRIFRYLKGHPKLGLWYPKASSFDLVAYSDSDYGGASQDRKSTTGGKYVAAARCRGQVLWIQNQLLDYGCNFMNTKIYIDNNSAICIVKNPVYHSKTKHIEIRHHFIRDCFEKKLISVDHIHTDENVADLLTKPFDAGRFQYLVTDPTEKGEHNIDFHPMVDFIEASPLRIETTKEGTKILATVDGIVRTVSESSLRRNLKLRDEEGISCLPDTEIFENLTLMGYNISLNQKFTFQKGQFSHQWKYLIHTIMKCLSPKSIGFNEFSSNIATALDEGSGTPTEPYHTPSQEVQPSSHTYISSSSLLPVTTTSFQTVTSTETTLIRQYTRRTRIAQSFVPPTVADEPASPQRDSSTLPHDLAPRVTSPAAVEGTQEVENNRLKEIVKQLEEREGAAATNSRDDAPIKVRSMNEGEAATERVSDDTEEMATVLTSMDAATVLASRVVDVPTGSGSIPTASTLAEGLVPTGSEEVPTASPIDAQVARELEEQLEKENQRRAEQIARDDEIARIHAEEELQSMIDDLDSNNEIVAKYLDEYR